MKRLTGKANALIPRNSLAWLLTAQIVVLLPHLPRLPLWVSALWIGCALWRIQIQRMRWNYPESIFKTAGIVLITLGVWLTEGTLIGLDAAVMLLLLLFMFKLLEMRTPRDAIVVIYLGFFIIATAFLFNQSIVLTVYQLFSLLVLIASLVGLQQTAGRNDPSRALRTGSVLLLQAVPLMIVLFLFFPRLGPLWAVNAPGQSAITGLAESMSPGDIADLARSGELAFRVQFEGEIPAHKTLYWRALTLSSFDGRSWSHLDFASRPEPQAWEPQGEPITYQVTTRATQQPWVFSLRGATSEDERLQLTRDYMLRARRPIAETTSYQATSRQQSLLEPAGLTPMQQRLYTLLPEESDPRSRAFAAQLRREYAEDGELVQALLRFFNQEPFYYTLRPDTLGLHTNDEFLFDSRRGFCAHFAGAMTFVLRAAGIPARIVAGYQGGEVNPAGNYVLVHQFDAHAWVEAWLPGGGWVSVDPTFQVAPERIERGIQAALEGEGSFLEDSLLSGARYRNINWINSVRLGWDDINFQWQLRVLGFQSDTQKGFFQRWLGTTDWQRVGVILLASAALVMIPLALWILRPERLPQDSRRRAWARLDRRLNRLRLQTRRGEGPRAWQARLKSALPGCSTEIDAFFDEYVHQSYATGSAKPARVMQARLREREQALRRSLPRKTPLGAIEPI
jgi:transglutaminase-like putative cysteine protease